MGVLSNHSQRARGELHVEVRDPEGGGLAATVELVGKANQVHRTFVAESDGRCVMQDLPFGIYSLSLSSDGFAQWADLIEIQSEVPVRLTVTLGLAAVTTQVEVSDLPTLVDPYQAGAWIPSGGRGSARTLWANQDSNSLT